ncbi:hypothetical protein CPB83DRAFT_897309, partial [Crepidotus variabilis]
MAAMDDFTLARKPRSDAAYGVEARKAIHMFKAPYRAAKTPAERDVIFRRDICVNLWNYWEAQGMDPPRDGPVFRDEVKKLAAWIHNNWRPKVQETRQGYTMTRVRDLEVLADLHVEKMTEAYKELLGVDEILDIHSQAIFNNRTAVAKTVKESLTVTEQRQLEAEVARRKKEGLPKEIQLRNASRHAAKKVKAAAEIWRKEMDLSTLVFFAYRGGDDKISVAFNSNFDRQGKTYIDKFSKAYNDKVLGMQRGIIKYMKKVNSPLLISGAEAAQVAAAALEQLTCTDNGFPIIPADIKNANKETLEVYFGNFIAIHYQMAGGLGLVPWKKLSEDTRTFVEACYLPRAFVLGKPRDVKAAKIKQFFEHILKREEKHSPSDSFRFARVIGRRGGDAIQAIYPGPLGSAGATRVKPRKSKAKPKPKGKAKHLSTTQLNALIPIDPSSRGVTPGNMPLHDTPLQSDWEITAEQRNGVGGTIDFDPQTSTNEGVLTRWVPAGVSNLGFDVPIGAAAENNIRQEDDPFMVTPANYVGLAEESRREDTSTFNPQGQLPVKQIRTTRPAARPMPTSTLSVAERVTELLGEDYRLGGA